MITLDPINGAFWLGLAIGGTLVNIVWIAYAIVCALVYARRDQVAAALKAEDDLDLLARNAWRE